MTNPIIPINDLARHARATGGDLAACALRVLDSGHYVLGPEVAGFVASSPPDAALPTAWV